MSTEKALVFDTNGNLIEMEAKLARKRSEGASAAVQSQIRTEIGVPASAEGLTPSNNLSDVSSAATSRDNLEVYDRAMLGDSIASKSASNGVRFLGNDKASAGDPALLIFSDGTNDEPFSGSFYINTTSLASAQGIAGKYVGSGIEWEFELKTDGKLKLTLYDNTASHNISATGDTVLVVNRLYYVGFSYNGNGNGGSDISLYVDEIAQTETAGSAGTYAAMHQNTGAFNVGGDINAKYFNGVIYSAIIWNLELSAAQHKELRRSGNWGLPGFPAGKAVGGVYTSDFSAGVDGFTTIQATATGNYDSGDAGHADTLRLVADDGSSDRGEKSGLFTKGNNYRVKYNRKVIVGTRPLVAAGGVTLESDFTDATWTTKTFEFKAATTDPLRIYPADAGSANDELLVDGIEVTDLGPRLNWQPQNIKNDGWDDQTTNGLNGTFTNASPLFNPSPQASTGPFTPTISFGGNSVGVVYSIQQGTYWVDENGWVDFQMRLALTNTGSSTGVLKIEGLPYTAVNSVGRRTFAVKLVGGNQEGEPTAVLVANTDKLELWGHTANEFQFTNTHIETNPTFEISGRYKKA